MDVAAPPGKVWKHVVAFSRLPEPKADDWLFRTGVAYPRQAKITGCGVGAIRHCIFSTGTFVEPIAVWDEPHRLTGSTWYTNDMGPQQYWKFWSDGIIHSIHLRVLNHVRNLSEAES